MDAILWMAKFAARPGAETRPRQGPGSRGAAAAAGAAGGGGGWGQAGARTPGTKGPPRARRPRARPPAAPPPRKPAAAPPGALHPRARALAASRARFKPAASRLPPAVTAGAARVAPDRNSAAKTGKRIRVCPPPHGSVRSSARARSPLQSLVPLKRCRTPSFCSPVCFLITTRAFKALFIFFFFASWRNLVT